MIELLVVIAVVGTLAAMLFPVLGKSKEKARQIGCMNNLRQLGIAFSMYLNDNKDTFPVGGSKTAYGPQPEDWIWWQKDRDINKSAILPHIGNFQANLFTCPSHLEAKLLQRQTQSTNDPYRFSYSFTSYQIDNGNNPGMASLITKKRETFMVAASSVNRPSEKIMLIEEGKEGLDDGRWVPGDLANSKLGYFPRNDPLSLRHGKKGNATFADGHVQLITVPFAKNLTNSFPAW